MLMVNKFSLLTVLFLGLFHVGLKAVPNQERLEIEKTYLKGKGKLDNIHVFYADEDKAFYIEDDGEIFKVENYCVDKELRNLTFNKLSFLLGRKKIIESEGNRYVISIISTDILGSFDSLKIHNINEEESKDIKAIMKPNAYLEIIKTGEGEYKIKLQQLLLGGGAGGAVLGCWLGKIVATAVCQTGIVLVGVAVSAVATPVAGSVVVATLESTLAPTIETISTTAAFVGGMSLMVATGPA